MKKYQHPTVGRITTAVGAVMIVVSIVVGQVFDIPGVVFHNVLQIGGFAAMVVGTLMTAGFFSGDKDGE